MFSVKSAWSQAPSSLWCSQAHSEPKSPWQGWAHLGVLCFRATNIQDFILPFPPHSSSPAEQINPRLPACFGAVWFIPHTHPGHNKNTLGLRAWVLTSPDLMLLWFDTNWLLLQRAQFEKKNKPHFVKNCNIWMNEWPRWNLGSSLSPCLQEGHYSTCLFLVISHPVYQRQEIINLNETPFYFPHARERSEI